MYTSIIIISGNDKHIRTAAFEPGSILSIMCLLANNADSSSVCQGIALGIVNPWAWRLTVIREGDLLSGCGHVPSLPWT